MTLNASVALQLGALQLEVELTAAPGAVLALLGPNGAGKTTLLRAVAGLQPITRGEIELDGLVLDAPDKRAFVAAEDRAIGYLFQDYLLFPHLSVLENVAFGMRSRRKPQPLETARTWLDRMELAALASSRPGELSGGQAQRVALARALAPEPRLLLLDEPLAALDASTKVKIRRELKDHLNRFEGITLLVSHDPVDAAALADRVLVIEEGRVVQEGTIPDITARPRSRYVADLVGVNLFRGEARNGEVKVGGSSIYAADAVNGDVFALVHPRSVSLYADRPQGSPRNVWRGLVTSVDSFGDRTRVRIEGPVTVVAEVTSAAIADLRLAGGEEVWVSFKASEVDVYPA
ncbi:MAG: ABC transporter ATP-binding protein [Candidatus Dormibacteraeota bacterium]|nr:ABC transporter ATP-binding protein [Candidatus Dormibacteraeota bacterium]